MNHLRNLRQCISLIRTNIAGCPSHLASARTLHTRAKSGPIVSLGLGPLRHTHPSSSVHARQMRKLDLRRGYSSIVPEGEQKAVPQQDQEVAVTETEAITTEPSTSEVTPSDQSNITSSDSDKKQKERHRKLIRMFQAHEREIIDYSGSEESKRVVRLLIDPEKNENPDDLLESVRQLVYGKKGTGLYQDGTGGWTVTPAGNGLERNYRLSTRKLARVSLTSIFLDIESYLSLVEFVGIDSNCTEHGSNANCWPFSRNRNYREEGSR